MRRRERFTGMVWLAFLEGEDRAQNTPAHPGVKDGTEHNIKYLAHDLGLHVEVEHTSDGWHVQVFPTPRSQARGVPFMAASYKGQNLSSIPAQAVWDYLRVQSLPGGNQFTNRAVDRWVA